MKFSLSGSSNVTACEFSSSVEIVFDVVNCTYNASTYLVEFNITLKYIFTYHRIYTSAIPILHKAY